MLELHRLFIYGGDGRILTRNEGTFHPFGPQTKMSIKKLISLVTPPAHPFEIGNFKKWRKIQDQLGLKLPKDLYDFAMHYGTGQFYGDFIVFNPFSKSYLIQLEDHKKQIQDSRPRGLDEFLANWCANMGYDPGEEPDLFPWGRDANGNLYWWLMEGQPKSWPIITRTEEYEFAEWNMPMLTFVVKIFTNEIVGYIDPGPFTPEKLVFEPKPL